ncbi:MAG: hypothetical protein WCL00_10960, partial [Bacteroidota bacterium]
MKTKIAAFIGFILLFCIGNSFGIENGTPKNVSGDKNKSPETITVQTSPELLTLTQCWAAEYEKVAPMMNIKISTLNGSNDAVPAEGSFSIVSEGNEPVNQVTPWKMVVGRDAIIAVMNLGNPYLKEIIKRGVTAADFKELLKNRENRTWNTLVKNHSSQPVTVYMIGDESVPAVLSSFMNVESMPTDGIRVAENSSLFKSISQDPFAIGFCRLTDLMAMTSQGEASKVTMMPIDKNENGRIDQFEKIYGNLDRFRRGVWVGKYPQAL